ncbi:MAG: serine/threonine protein kinase [Oscillospiraceae bacterium]|nr:serine/threonine protein kinase [Oscillospiraceae bacterium]
MLTMNMVVDNRYKILDEIGRGGMSIVYRATVERSGKIWAVKEVRKDGRNDYNVVKQNLIAEIETLKEVKHPKLPEIADVIDNEDSFIIVMDYIEGVSLDKILARKGPQPEEKVVSWAKQLCEVLGYLHSRKIIYRDMKPSNVMLKKNGEITIIDFGTAKKYEYNSGETTGLGTAGFAAPEQYGGHGRTDARTDIFCLGMTMYSLLTGVDPQKDFIPDTSIRKVNPSFSAGLDYIIRKCTAKNPDERYQSCEELMYYLENYKMIDKGSRKKKVIKMSLFVTCFLISIVSGICSYLLNLQAKAQASDNYQELMKQADMIMIDSENDPDHAQEQYQQKTELYTQAIAVPEKAGEKQAYLNLIETYKENDDLFTEEELTQLNYLITQNEAALQANPDTYIDICYETGNLLWYYYNDANQMTKSKRAVKWFNLMLNYIAQHEADERVQTYQADPENAKKIGLAESYKEIGTFYDEIAGQIKQGKDDGEYKKLFWNLQNLLDQLTVSDKDKTTIVRLELLEMTRYSIHRYAADFRRDGIEENGIMALYKRIQNVLNTITLDESHPLYAKKAEIESNMPDTLTAIETAYGITRKETKTS